MKEETKFWLDQAQEHFADALYLYEGRRYSMSVYCCHQALEKVLKAAIVEFGNQAPPKIHNLDALARQTRLSFPHDWLPDLAEITRHFWRVRYPDYQTHVYTTKEKVTPTLEKTKEVFLWMQKQFNQP